MYISAAKKANNVIVIGGGAAGMMAALFAARGGADVTLLEKNEKLGKKIYITGKGRCNVTNACDTDEFVKNVPRNPRFLYSALRALPPEGTMELLAQLGCETKTERGRRVFPVSDKASDVTRALEKGLKAAGVRILLQTPVKEPVIEDGRVTGARLENGETLPCGRVIVCTGGLSYPSTGSTGDGYRWAKAAGHPVTALLPSLTGLNTRETWPRDVQGLSLKNVTLTAKSRKKTLYTELGKCLFTHFGLSGPLALECSAHLPENGQAEIALDLKPGLTGEQLDARLQREFASAGKKQLQTVLQSLLPRHLADLFPGIIGMDGQKTCSQISAAERRQLSAYLKALPLTVTGTRPFTEAIITRGGVDVRSLSPSTMESKMVKGLYFAGEIIDADAHTGGYNLQIAFATGALAGQSAARDDDNI